MTPRVKVCCIASAEEARLAIDAGAAALGLVSAMPSGPGVIDEATIAEIASQVPPGVATFLLTSLQDAEAIVEQHTRCRTTALQLVDRLAVAELRALRAKLPGIQLVQVVHVCDGTAYDEAVAAAPLVDALLLDSGNPSLAVKELGGTGRIHDWQLSARIRAAVAKPVFLAGGLSASNVRQAIGIVQPFGVDLCTGVREGGALDAKKLAKFMAAVRGARQELGLVSVVVEDYDAAIAFYVDTLGFELVEDLSVPEQGKRWVVVSPPGSGCRVLLARAANPHQATRVGDQTGGRVFLFLFTDDFQRDFDRYRALGVTFVREPKREPYGIVAVFRDLYGNLWDLVQRS